MNLNNEQKQRWKVAVFSFSSMRYTSAFVASGKVCEKTGNVELLHVKKTIVSLARLDSEMELTAVFNFYTSKSY